MFRNPVRQCALLLILIASGVCAASAAEPLQYELHFERPNTHLLDVTIHASALMGAAVEFGMPDWAPGSYVIQNFAAEVQDFRAADSGGRPLSWRKTDSQTWRIALAGAHNITVDYRVYADTMDNDRAQYNEKHVFFDGPAVWMYLVGGKDRPAQLSVTAPNGWKIATGMEQKGGTFFANSYDSFADSPIEMSDFAEKTFDVAGTTYHVIVDDVEGKRDFTKFTNDLKRVVENFVPMFAPVASASGHSAPFTDYWFLFHIWPGTGGGLEHLNSTQIDFGSDWDDTNPDPEYGTKYKLKLFIAAHEFFHAWNVKRLRPRPLGPFDYTQMVHTPSLWISEGLTSYYGDLALERAGIITPSEYLDGIAGLITNFEREPGRTERSIEDTSWDTWFEGVRAETNLENTTYSYYDGGQVVGHLLDFLIRQDSRNQKSLDDWMRLMYQRFAMPKPGFEPDDAIKAASELAGTDLSDFFRRYVSGKEPLPYETYFGYAGISVEKTIDPNKAWLGVAMRPDNQGRAQLTEIVPDSPADLAGLERGDTVAAIDGTAMNMNQFGREIAGHKPGDELRLTIFRFAATQNMQVKLAADPYPTYSLKPMDNPTDLQRAIYKSWLGIQ